MPFAYYERLSRREQAIYRRSDEITAIAIPARAGDLAPAVEALREALSRDDERQVAASSAEIAGRISVALGAAAPLVHVLAVRPRADWGELHGLYTLDAHEVPEIRLWMRTARHARVVAFRTFLRTLLHELAHHLDLAVLGLDRSFHTEGFFKRESSLFRQLVPPRASLRPRAGPPPVASRRRRAWRQENGRTPRSPEAARVPGLTSRRGGA